MPSSACKKQQPGDLVYFGRPIHHVGIYIGGGRFIEAPYTGAFFFNDTPTTEIYTLALPDALPILGVDGLRRHAPLCAVDRLAQLGQFLVVLELARTYHVAHQVVLGNGQLRVIAPGV